MEIRQLKYYIAIVQSDCNMSKAAKKLFVSQSAISQTISSFEEAHQLTLFYRDKGRFSGLTPIGHKYYKYALEMVDLYDRMSVTLQKESLKMNNVVRIGIPSITLRTLLRNFIFEAKKVFPTIQIEIVEGGCQFLYEKLEEGEIDLAILMDPLIRTDEYEDQVIIQDRFVVFMDRQHPLAAKENLEWSDIQQHPFATFNDSFSTNRLVMSQFAHYQLHPEVIMNSSSWEYLIDLVTDTKVLTILPETTYVLMDQESIVLKQLKTPLEFDIYISRRKYQEYPQAQMDLFEWLQLYMKRILMEKEQKALYNREEVKK